MIRVSFHFNKKNNFSRGTLGNEDSQLLNAHNNFLKTQSDGLKCELSVREAEISSLKTRLESTERTNQENRMHLEGKWNFYEFLRFFCMFLLLRNTIT